jgi:hypothetical protein
MQSLELATPTGSTNINSLPHAVIDFLPNGTYEGSLYSASNEVAKPLMHVSSTWHVERGRLYINAVNVLGSTNLVVTFRVRQHQLFLNPDPMTPPYAFHSIYGRSQTH